MKIAQIETEVKLRDANIYTDGKLLDLYKYVDGKFSAVEQELPRIFKITDKSASVCRCVWCEEKTNF